MAPSEPAAPWGEWAQVRGWGSVQHRVFGAVIRTDISVDQLRDPVLNLASTYIFGTACGYRIDPPAHLRKPVNLTECPSCRNGLKRPELTSLRPHPSAMSTRWRIWG